MKEIVKMYTTGCPKCKILEKKLQAKNIAFTKCDDIKEMQLKGISAVPVLEVSTSIPNEDIPYTNIMNFNEAVKWVNNK